ncbi:MAG: CocE/NonD family hydrolase [Alphaproteobacteria bacterium]
MNIDESILERIEEVEHVWIEMPDGTRLSARLFLPRDADARPVPALLEYLPYRKRDFMRARDEPMHRWFAGHGYASVRVDVRGSGDSEGILEDEYSEQELADADRVIAWIAAQPWCDGGVGMMGISWGGFNALQVAARRPPALKAIITLCSSDDRYADDAHYMGGCLLNENIQWGTFLTLYSALPPDPRVVGEDRWRDMWRARLDAVRPFPAVWMQHQARDAYWRRGSVCEDYGAIEIPVYAVGGWADGYTNAIPRLMANLTGPKKALIGPWAHNYPQDGRPGPAIGFLQEAKRWWDRWLKGHENGIMDEPAVRVWLQDSVAPAPQHETWPGRWVAEPAWPTPEPLVFHLNAEHLDAEPRPPVELSVASPQGIGMRAGEWCGFGADGDMPRDQRPDDGGSLVFDSDPLSEPLELLGAPVVELDLKSDRPVAMLVARLCEVAADGASLRLSYGLLNLTHRDGHGEPKPLAPGTWYRVRLALNDMAHRLPAGHRVRLALSTTYWPIAWPAPEKATLTFRTGGSTLALPVRPARSEDQHLAPFETPASAPGGAVRGLTARQFRRKVEIDLASNEMVYSLQSDGGELDGATLARIDAVDLDVGFSHLKRFRIIETDPLSAQAEFSQRVLLRRDDGWRVRVTLSTRLTSTAEMFQFSGELSAFEGDDEIATRHWTTAIPRLLV